MRGLILTVSKLVITTTLFVFLMFLSESRSVATGMCGALLSMAAVCSAQAASGGGGAAAAEDQFGGDRGGDGGGGRGREEEDEEADTALLAQKR